MQEGQNCTQRLLVSYLALSMLLFDKGACYRIRNLEDAIKSEKTLRVKMQAILSLSQQGMGSRTPPGGRLPALRES